MARDSLDCAAIARVATRPKKKSVARAGWTASGDRDSVGLPQPLWLDTAPLIERYIYPAYAQRERVEALLEPRSKRSVPAQVAELWERCAANGWLPTAWTTGGGPRCCEPCLACGARGISPNGEMELHRAGCAEGDAPRSIEMAVALATERALVTDADALAREWRAALVPWGAAPCTDVYWTYEAHPPWMLRGWDSTCDLECALYSPAAAAAFAVRGRLLLHSWDSGNADFGSFDETPWIYDALTAINAMARARKRPKKLRRVFDDAMVELLGFALEGASLWHLALASGAKVEARSKKFPVGAPKSWLPVGAVVGQAFSALPNPWPPLVALLATGAQPVGSFRGAQALNLLPYEVGAATK